MKFLIASFLFISAAHALDYDPNFQIKHRYNGHIDASKKSLPPPASAQQTPQKMEESKKMIKSNKKE